MQLLVSEGANLAGFAFPDDCGLVPAPRRQMPVNAVMRQIDLAADEPFRPWRVPVEHFPPWLKPVQFMRYVAPESLRVAVGIRAQPFIVGDGFDVCPGTEIGRRSEQALFFERRLNVVRHGS